MYNRLSHRTLRFIPPLKRSHISNQSLIGKVNYTVYEKTSLPLLTTPMFPCILLFTFRPPFVA